ncbi:hypothetical protein [Nonomuraea sp. NPDC005650]|uniref:hypothetical protein n=1 Tax=Nonomuraea sp. NPDC005650 TaxID=3157045 RepID=UPI0033B4E81D
MNAKALAFVAFLLIGSGVLTGLLPVTSDGDECGSAFVERTRDELLSDGEPKAATGGCDDVRNLVRIPAIVLMAAGGATLCGAVLTRWRITLTRG